jgi:hypothetical protein
MTRTFELSGFDGEEEPGYDPLWDVVDRVRLGDHQLRRGLEHLVTLGLPVSLASEKTLPVIVIKAAALCLEAKDRTGKDVALAHHQAGATSALCGRLLQAWLRDFLMPYTKEPPTDVITHRTRDRRTTASRPNAEHEWFPNNTIPRHRFGG